MKKEITYHNFDGTKHTKTYKFPDKFNKDGYLFDKRRKSIKNEFKILPRELSRSERGSLSDMRVLIGRDQLLVYKSGRDWKPHTVTTIAKFLEMSERQTKDLIKKAKKCAVLAEVELNKVKYYMYNPYYERVSDRISFIVYLAFKDSVLKDEIEQTYRNLFLTQAFYSEDEFEVLK